jgi:type II secretion system protein H
MRHRNAGFTLLEMIVTLTILSLVALIVFPQLKPAVNVLDQATAAVASQLRLAHARAISSASPTFISLDVQQKSVRNEGDQLVVQMSNKIELDASYGRDKSDGSMPRFHFYPMGNASGGKIVLTLGGQSKTVTVNWVTGAVTVL